MNDPDRPRPLAWIMLLLCVVALGVLAGVVIGVMR